MKYSIAILFLLFLSFGCNKDDEEEEQPTTGNKAPISIDANDILSDATFTSLVVELAYSPGAKPTNETVDNIRQWLSFYTKKPSGIEINQKETSAPPKAKLEFSDVSSFEDNNRSEFSEDSRATIWMYFTSAEYEDENVLGIAYGGSSICIFQRLIQANSGGIGEPDATTLETAVTLHEFGHLLGLVNNGSAMQSEHQDEPNGRHCDVDDCLMYWAVETTDFIANLTGGKVPELDAQCEADLKANGGR